MEEHVLLEGQGWSPDPPCLAAPILHSDLKNLLEQHLSYVTLFGKPFISKFN